MKQIIILYSGSTSQKALMHIVDGDNINIIIKEEDKATEIFRGSKFTTEKYALKTLEENKAGFDSAQIFPAMNRLIKQSNPEPERIFGRNTQE